MRFLRKIEGKTRRDRIRNKIIRETAGVQPLQECVERSKPRRYGMNKRIVKRVYEPREIEKMPRKKGVTWKEVERTVEDREKWKALWDPLYTGRQKRME